MAHNTLRFENNGARIDMKNIFWRSLKLNCVSGKLVRTWAKFLRTPKNVHAPTPMQGVDAI